jgi:hypothetical protein
VLDTGVRRLDYTMRDGSVRQGDLAQSFRFHPRPGDVGLNGRAESNNDGTNRFVEAWQLA